MLQEQTWLASSISGNHKQLSFIFGVGYEKGETNGKNPS